MHGKLLPFLTTAVVFAAAYGQAPLYYSNQNQYFLHGLAWAGNGLLDEDWLAKTQDPTPIFSAMVAVTARLMSPWLFHAYHALLMGVYAAALLNLFWVIAGPLAPRRWPIFAAALVLVHSAAARWISGQLLGIDYPWYLQAGLASQYVLGAMLQPSVFGVFLVAAISLFASGRELLAALCVVVAAIMHNTYLLPGAIITAGFLLTLVREKRLGAAVLIGVITLVPVLPWVVYTMLFFGPTDAERFELARDILVRLRLPHHASPERWFDVIAGLQIAWIVLGIYLARKVRLEPAAQARGSAQPLACAAGSKARLLAVLCVCFVLASSLTLYQVASDSTFLALLFPWRMSTVLVPIATGLVLAWLIALPLPRFDAARPRSLAFLLLPLLAAAGLEISFGRLAFPVGDEDQGVMDYVSSTKMPGDVYFVPVKIPELQKLPRGASSSDFKPMRVTRDIPLEMQRFRLNTEAPIYVDFKAIPYKDVEVIEWHNRLTFASRFQEQLRDGEISHTAAAISLRSKGVTHMICPANLKVRWWWGVVYRDDNYQVLELSQLIPRQTVD